MKTIIRCGKCHKYIPDEVYFIEGICPHCGNDLRNPPYGSYEISKECGVKIAYAYGMAYCPNCGQSELRDPYHDGRSCI